MPNGLMSLEEAALFIIPDLTSLRQTQAFSFGCRHKLWLEDTDSDPTQMLQSDGSRSLAAVAKAIQKALGAPMDRVAISPAIPTR
jgi:hypothetical protein